MDRHGAKAPRDGGRERRAPLHTMVNAGMVNEGGFLFLPAANFAIFRVFTPKCAIQKVR
jgi:hypothetical protein